MKEDFRSGPPGRRLSRRSRSGSKSPMRSKVSVVAPLIRGRDRERRESSRSKYNRGNDKYDNDNRNRLRMDEPSRSFRDEHDYRDREVREDRNVSLKRNSNSVFADLDRAVKKAREERNTVTGNYWNKKVIEAEEKDPNRWGHSGFKELYSRDIDAPRGTRKKDYRRRSGSRSRSTSRNPTRRHVLRKSRSGSPMLKQLHKARQRNEVAPKIKPLLPEGFLSSNKTGKSGTRRKIVPTGKIRPLLSLDTGSPPKRLNTFRSRSSPVDTSRRTKSGIYRSAGETTRVRSNATKPRQRLGPPVKRNINNRDRRARSKSRDRKSTSFTGSDSRTPSPQLRRPHSYKSETKSRPSNKSVSKSRSRSRSRVRSSSRRSHSSSSSSVSSEDEDVLELHPRRRPSKSYSISRSESNSSRSKSDSSGSSVRKSNLKRGKDFRSSSSSSSGSDESGHSLAMAKDKDRSARNNQLSPVVHPKPVAKIGQVSNPPPRQTVQAVRQSNIGAKSQTSHAKTPAVTTKAKPLPSQTKQQGQPVKKPTSAKAPQAATTETPALVLPLKKLSVPSTKQAPQTGKQPTAIVKQSSVQSTKQVTQTGKPGLPVKKQVAPVAKKVAQPMSKQPSNQKQPARILADSAKRNSNAGKNLKEGQDPGPSDIDSDSSVEGTEVSSNRGQNKEKAASKNTSSKGIEKNTGKTSPSGSKEEGESVSDSESGSDSSSESESEPRMTLSERFKKLTQMTTDKREFAKPVLSVDEIDTKLKVVKDLRCPTQDTKVYLDGQNGQAQRQSNWNKNRPKTPDFGEGETRYPSDERRRHFERMSRDAPSERPADWSDMTVRYTYYRDRGCFDERPLSLEEYSKWETWYYEYKNWLENEKIYNQQMVQEQQAPMIREQEFNITDRIGWRGPPDQRGLIGERTVRTSMSSRLEQRIVRSPPDNRPYYTDRNNGRGNFHVNDRFARRIGRAPSGSLVVNIRQENNNFGHPRMQRGRRV